MRLRWTGVGILALLAAPAAAQQSVSLQKDERAALRQLSTALAARDYATAGTAVTAAQNAARSGYARYLASALQYRLGAETGNVGLQQTAIDAMLASGAAPASELPFLYRNRGALAENAGKYEQAEGFYARWAEAAPGDQEALLALAQVKNLRKKPGEAVALLDRAASARRAAGQPISENLYKRGVSLALANRLAQPAAAFSRGLVTDYSSPDNWRDAVLVSRDLAPADPASAIDGWRLLRQAKALAGERDYLAYARALVDAGLPAEAKAVLDEGVAARMVDPAKPEFKALLLSAGKAAAAGKAGLAGQAAKATAGPAALKAADAYLSYGEPAKAVPLYRAALAAGGVDADLANLRLGIALAMSGNRAEAPAALGAVGGARKDLASLWMVWLGRAA